VYMAAYWRYPSPESPSYQAFKLYTNYDGEGSRFDGTALAAYSADIDRVTAYASLAGAGSALRIMLINKQLETEMPLRVISDNFSAGAAATRYTLDERGVSEEPIEVNNGRVIVTLPAYSATLLVFPAGGETGE
jgi:hypothetical protein